VNTYLVTASFRANVNDRHVTEWGGSVKAQNREHALLLAGIRIAHRHGNLIPESLRVMVARRPA
jgi:hypothetical protein